MDNNEKDFWFNSGNGIRPYLRYKGNGMPRGSIEQIAWLLLCGSGCGYCKTCRDEPCNIAGEETCTHNISEYIRNTVRAEKEETTEGGTEGEKYDAVLIVRHWDNRLGAEDITAALSMLKGDGSDILPVIYTDGRIGNRTVYGYINGGSTVPPVTAEFGHPEFREETIRIASRGTCSRDGTGSRHRICGMDVLFAGDNV
ncbi:MAG: hypothetical protein LUE14_07780 [Clostridiales bacterium]|nr:hypothetical protein [Clostridiales bacterium]